MLRNSPVTKAKGARGHPEEQKLVITNSTRVYRFTWNPLDEFVDCAFQTCSAPSLGEPPSLGEAKRWCALTACRVPRQFVHNDFLSNFSPQSSRFTRAPEGQNNRRLLAGTWCAYDNGLNEKQRLQLFCSWPVTFLSSFPKTRSRGSYVFYALSEHINSPLDGISEGREKLLLRQKVEDYRKRERKRKVQPNSSPSAISNGFHREQARFRYVMLDIKVLDSLAASVEHTKLFNNETPISYFSRSLPVFPKHKRSHPYTYLINRISVRII